MSLKKYPVFTTTLAIFGAACLAGVGLAIYTYVVYSQSKSNLAKTERQIATTIKNKVVPYVPEPTFTNDITPAARAAERAKNRVGRLVNNLDDALVNQKEIRDRETALFNDIQGEKINVPSDLLPAPFVVKLREANEKLRKDAAAISARIFRPADFGFGFSRYLKNDGTQPPPNKEDNRILDQLAVEKQVIEFLVGELLKAKNGNDESGAPDKNPLILQAVQREPVELPPDRRSIGNTTDANDEFTPKPEDLIRREGVADTLYFRLVFTARSDVLRRFVNQVKNSQLPVVLRGVTVAPARPEVLNPPEDAANAGRPAALPVATADAAGTAPALPGFGTPAANTAVPALPGFENTPAAANAAPALPGFGTPAGTAGAAATGKNARAAAAKPTAPAAPVEVQIVPDAPSEFTVAFEYLIPLHGLKPTTKATTTNQQ